MGREMIEMIEMMGEERREMEKKKKKWGMRNPSPLPLYSIGESWSPIKKSKRVYPWRSLINLVGVNLSEAKCPCIE